MPDDFELPDCLNKECIEEYDVDFLDWKIVKVFQSARDPAGVNCRILKSDDREVREEVDLFLIHAREKIQATPKKGCGGDGHCVAHWEWIPQLHGKGLGAAKTQVDINFKTGDGCKYTAVVDVWYQLGFLKGVCGFPEKWSPKRKSE
jgi:hypothetical protein